MKIMLNSVTELQLRLVDRIQDSSTEYKIQNTAMLLRILVIIHSVTSLHVPAKQKGKQGNEV